MSSSKYVGRHGSPRRRRLSLPSVGTPRVARTAAKSVAGVGIVLGSGAFVIAPSSAIGGALAADDADLDMEQSFTASSLLQARDAETATASKASRSAERNEAVAITAPTSNEGASIAETVAIEPVAKPKPKPKPKPEPAEAEDATAETGTEAGTEAEAEQAEPTPEPTVASTGVQTGNYASQAAALGLGYNASRVYSAVRTQFPDMTNIGGYRAGDPGDHGTGNAVDIMVSGARGDQVSAWLKQNAGQLNIKYIIWQQTIWFPSGESRFMEDRGSATANHYDHVHVSVH